MEVLYLWVNQFKNLAGGYTLSARYDVSYDGFELITLKKKKEAISGLFDANDRINISAVIGKNGCGKTSIIKIIMKLIYDNYFDRAKKQSAHRPVQAFMLLEVEGQIRYLSTNNRSFKLEILGDAKLDKSVKPLSKPFYCISFNYILDSLKDDSTDSWVEDIYHKADDYMVPCLLEPYKKDNIINIGNLHYLTQQRMMLHFNSLNANPFLKNIFAPTHVHVSLDIPKLMRILTSRGKYTDAAKHKYSELLTEIYTLLEEKKKEEQKLTKSTKSDVTKTLGYFNEEEFGRILSHNIDHLDALIRNKLSCLPLYILNNLYICNKVDRYHKRNRVDVTRFGFNGDRIEITINDLSHATLKLRNALEYQEELLKTGYSYEQIDKSIEIKDIFSCLPSWFDLEFFDKKGRTISSLSSGEKTLFIFLSTLLYQINNLESRWVGNIRKDYHNILLLLDETDLGLHPKWQRDYITYLVSTLSVIDGFNFHIVCTSHSPFIVSDIPKQNILFLDKGKISRLMDNSNTFGGNIHTLLHDSFFMQKDMMMGGFAESKIGDLISFCRGVFSELNKLESEDALYAYPKSEYYNRFCKLKEKYQSHRDNFIKIQQIIGEKVISTAIYNNIAQLDAMFGISTEISDYDRDAILQLIKRDPTLRDKVIGALF